MRIRPVFGAVSLCLVVGVLAGYAQVVKPVVKPTVQDVAPCCEITSIDGDTGIVTARIIATRRALAFKVTDATLLRSLRIAQAISANFQTGRVTINGVTPCCEITTLSPGNEAVSPVANAPAAPAGPSATTGFGTHGYEVSGVEVALMSVQRTSGNTLTVRWEYRNTTSQPRKLGESFAGMGWSEVFSLVYEAYVVDGRTRYPVQKDDAGNLIAARHGPGKIVTIAAKETHAAWARFGAPPAATTKVTIFIPGTEPFEDITIGTSGSGLGAPTAPPPGASPTSPRLRPGQQ